jgi:glycosyltransferase involved in cell wall biosynthesis
MNISAVVTVYNKEKEIARTLTSVYNQTLPAAEIIVVDDGSADKSAEIVEKMKVPELRLVRQGNTGVYGSRNRGIIESKYELVAFLDGDDTWEPGFLEAIEELYQKYPSCGIFGTAFQIKENSSRIIVPRYRDVPPSREDGILKNYFISASKGSVFSSSSVAVPKEVFNHAGMFTVDAGPGGDKEMWIRIAVDYPVAFCNKILATWHKDASNRATKVCYYRPDPPCVIAGRSILKRANLRKDIRKGLSLYMKTQLIFQAAGLIVCGKRRKGRKVLLQCGIPSSCPVKWLLYVCVSYLPSGLIPRLYDYANYIRYFLYRLFKRNRSKKVLTTKIDREPQFMQMQEIE